MLNFTSQLILWYKQHYRSLPWRETKNPYAIWISEIILQQTRVVQGIGYYERFMKAFPEVCSLANAAEDEVLKMWEGLGYYSRARNLHAAAKFIMNELGGEFPNTYKALLQLKGVGPYTAAAISSICFNEHQTVVDGNVYRVLSRVYGIDTAINSTEGIKEFYQLAHSLNSGNDYGLFNQALMEFGAIQCMPKKPLCDNCIFSQECYAIKNSAIDTLPVKLNKVKIKERYLHFVFIKDKHNNILVQKRKGNGIWKGLYQFPLIETEKDVELDELMNYEWMGSLTSGAEVTIKRVVSMIHKLTHQKLFIRIVYLSIPSLESVDTYEKICLNDVNAYAFPKPLSEWLSTL